MYCNCVPLCSAQGAVASNDEKVTWMRLNVSDDEVTMRIGSEAQVHCTTCMYWLKRSQRYMYRVLVHVYTYICIYLYIIMYLQNYLGQGSDRVDWGEKAFVNLSISPSFYLSIKSFLCLICSLHSSSPSLLSLSLLSSPSPSLPHSLPSPSSSPGYWLVNVMADPSLSTTMASTQLARAAFIKNEPLPKDDMVQEI